MKALLIYPETPQTFWSFHWALDFISKKAALPPLGLVTLAAMLPENWDKKIVDLNVEKLTDEDLTWANMIFLSGMNVHTASIHRIVARCKDHKKTVVGGGPVFTLDWESFPEIDHFVLNEAEETLPFFLEDLEKGTLKKLYQCDTYPDISGTPVPRWNLLKLNRYASLSIQYSRGCPFDCEFCSITMLNGRTPRMKTSDRFLKELQCMYDLGWRGDVFIVDDNIAGNRRRLKQDLLPALITWLENRDYPFAFTTEISIDTSDDEELVDLLARANITHVFVGIETPDTESLTECGKRQNCNRDLVGSVRKFQNSGISVSGGFIVGFDHDGPSIFRKQIDFIQKSGIVTAMVGLLNAPLGTKLHKRLATEKRIVKTMSGDNMDGSLNFIPKMDKEILVSGYKKILSTIYAPSFYYKRLRTFVREFKPRISMRKRVSSGEIKALFKALWRCGIRGKEKIPFWGTLVWGLFRQPSKLDVIVRMAVYGFHFRKVAETV
ncbi:MAG: DUF4070 domain-containing protein [Spirochaetales bacterium]|nr:DUF4070 domain-containing protein [Spirochaetales bacterium]